MDENAKSLRRAFKEPSLAQIKKTAGRLFKKNAYSKLVVDKKALGELRAYAYKSKLAKELKDENKKTSPD